MRTGHTARGDAPAGSVARGSVGRILLDHDQISVERDSHGGVEGNLEGSAHVLCTDSRP